MKNKIVGILICILLIISSFIAIGEEDKSESGKLYYPEDFELDAYCGGFSLWTDVYRVQIDSEGHGVYSIQYANDRATAYFTIIDEFNLDQNEMNELWDEILANDFFNLSEEYSESDIFSDSDILVLGGTFANIFIIGNGIQHMVETQHVGVPQFDNIIMMINSLTPGDYDLFYNGIYNIPPFAPSSPSGPTSGNYQQEHTYTTSAIDLDNDNLYYRFDWGDGGISDWIGPFEAGEAASAKHKWSSEGEYNISAQVKDDPNGDGDLSDGIESGWSESLAVRMPKTKIYHSGILMYLQRLIDKFPIFNSLIGFLNLDTRMVGFQITKTPTPPTEIKLDEEKCEITITIRIQIWGEGASDALASQIENAVESKLNKDKDGNPWKLKCPKEECKKEEPGCTVKIDVIIKYAGTTRPDTGEGWHVLYVGPRQSGIKLNLAGERFVSFIIIADANKNDNIVDYPRPNDATSNLPPPPSNPVIHNGGTVGCLHADDTIGTWAHEILHLMGLDDKYTSEWVDADGDNVRDADEVKAKPKPGHEDDIMANVTKWLQQWAIDKTMERINLKCPCKCCPEDQDNTPPENKIETPQNGEQVSSPLVVGGYADDGPGGSGVALLDYKLVWASGSYDGADYPINPPKEYVSYTLGPLNLNNYIDEGDWISITVFATDAAGNTGSDTVTVTLIAPADETPPYTEKIIGQPNEDGGYIIWPYTPITFEATDDDSGVNHIYYAVWWDANGDGIVETLMGSETIYDDTLTFSVNMWGVLSGYMALKWQAVDNAGNEEAMHYQEHFVMEG